MKIFITCLVLISHHEVLSQIIRPIGFEQSLTEVMEGPRQYIQQLEQIRQLQQEDSQLYLQQFNPYDVPSSINIPSPATNVPNSLPNVPNFNIKGPNAPLALINDCSPSVCKNLANTIQLMTISSLLQNKEGGDEVALRLAAPILNNLLSGSPVGVSRSIMGSSNIAPKFVRPNLVKTSSRIPSLSIPTRMVVTNPNMIPNNVLSNVSTNGQIDRGLLSQIIKLLGGLQ